MVFIVRALGDQIADVVHVENALEKLGVRLVPDGDEDALRREHALFLRLIVIERDALDARFLGAVNFLDLGVPKYLDLVDARERGPA